MANEELVSEASQFAVEVSSHSPLTFSKLRQFREVVFWERADLPDFPPRDTDLIIPLNVQDRIDNLANTAYEDPNLFWVLAIANEIRLPPLQMNPGFGFRYPDGVNVFRVIRGEAV